MAVFHRRSNNGTKSQHTRSTTLASATLVTRRQIRTGTGSSKRHSWQSESWQFFDSIGELHATVRWLGNAMSRARLYIAAATNDGGGDPQPADNPPESAQHVLTELMSGSTGQGEMLRRISANLEVAGEVYLVRLPHDHDPTVGPHEPAYRWIVASTDEFSFNGGRARVTLPETGEKVDIDPDTSTVIRMWSPHPRSASEPDSQVRANLPALREVMGLSQHITATVESRLAGAGVLAIPKSATLPNPSVEEGANPLHHNGFVDALMQGMITPINDRDNASAVVPIVLSVDDEAIGKLQHLTFATELDSKVTEMRRAALERFAAGSDLPQEVVLGLGDSTNHWSSAEIEDMAIKLSVEPMCGVICDALTQQLLWPALRALGEDNPEQWAIWYDTSELAQRPDRSAEAQALYDKGVLGPESLLRENGFTPDDMPNDDEKRQEFARQVVLAQPDLIAPLAPFIGFAGLEERLKEATAPEPDSAVPGDPGDDPNDDGGGDADTARHGGSPEPPSQRDNQQAALDAIPQPRGAPAADGHDWQVAAIELIALRALELAGKRLLTNSPRGVRGKPDAQQVHSWDLHTVAPTAPRNLDKLLDGAFDLADPVIGAQPGVRDAVDTYCRQLIAAGRPHRREYLVSTLRHAGCLV